MSYKNINQGFDELLSKMKKKYSDSEESFEPEEIAYQTIIESKIMGFPKRYRDASFDKYQLVGHTRATTTPEEADMVPKGQQAGGDVWKQRNRQDDACFCFH